MAMPKIALLLRLLAAIDEGRSSLEDLKRKLDAEQPPSTRTLRRYLATLSDAGFPWRYDRAAGTYGFEAGYSLRRLELSTTELFGLLALKGIANSLGGTLGASMDEMADKLTSVAGAGARRVAAKPAVRVVLADPQLDGEASANFELLQKAQRQRQSVRFTYVDKAGRRSQRYVDVYGFVVSSGRIYAVAYDRDRGAKRVFALDNVSAPRIAPQHYTLPDDFDIEAFAAGSVSGIYSGEPVVVRVHYSAVVAGAARADRVVRERTVADLPDGGVEITYVVADPSEFVRWAMKWGAQAQIVDPPEVRSQAVALAREILDAYESRAAQRSVVQKRRSNHGKPLPTGALP